MRLVLDSSVVGFLFFRQPKVGQEGLATTSRRLVEEGNHELFIPAPALAEALAWLPEAARLPALKGLVALPGVRVVPFDQASAVLAAGLGPVKLVDRRHQKVKVDLQIVASARRYEADGLCSVDGDFDRVVRASKWKLRVGPPEEFIQQVPLALR